MTVPLGPGPIVVTGGRGFVGSRLIHRLRAIGSDVRAWTRPEVDLLDAASVEAAVSRDCPHTLFHLAAAGVSVGSAHDPKVASADLTMMETLIHSLRPDTRMIYAGSMAEYGVGGVLSEANPCVPATAYAIGKFAAGRLGAAYLPQKGVSFCNARLFGVYGPGEAPQRLFPFLLQALASGRPVPLSDGLQRRDFIHVDDACDAMIALAALDTVPQLVNIGTGSSVSIGEVARWIADAMQVSRDLLRFGESPRSPGDQNLLQADTRLLASLIGAAPPQRLQPGFDLSLLQA
jgi:nucleoside-diphosphate-sugar epimerase